MSQFNGSAIIAGMGAIFNVIFSNELKMPVQNIQALIDSYHERRKTGVARLGYASEKQLCFLFNRGEIVNCYLVTPGKWEALPADRAMSWMLSAGDAYAKSISFSPFGLLMTKILIQARSETRKIFTRQSQIAEYLETIRARPEAALARLDWKNAAGAAFFAPDANPHFNFISEDVILDETGNYEILYKWSEPQCALDVLAPDLSVDAWQEYYLRSAFAKICEDILLRFETLTGRALVDSLVRLVDVFASRQNLDISVAAKRIEDREVFSTPQDAARSYRLLLGEIFEHFSSVIGARLHASTLREIIKNLPERELQVLRAFELLPQGYFYE